MQWTAQASCFLLGVELFGLFEGVFARDRDVRVEFGIVDADAIEACGQ
jgi:hypothetical protein